MEVLLQCSISGGEPHCRWAFGHMDGMPHTPIPKANSGHPLADTGTNILLCPHIALLSLFVLARKVENASHL